MTEKENKFLNAIDSLYASFDPDILSENEMDEFDKQFKRLRTEYGVSVKRYHELCEERIDFSL